MARLARLELDDGEVESMARELSGVLDHIAKIGELDLDDVPPTTHVVEVAGRLRPDEPRPCLPREVALEQAPPSPTAASSSPAPRHERRADHRACPPPRPPRRSRPAALRGGAVRGLPRARAERPASQLNCFTWVAD